MFNGIRQVVQVNKRDILFAKAVSGGGSSPAPTLIEKSINQNGTYSASDDEADGYSKVTVNVVGDYNAKFVPNQRFSAKTALNEINIQPGVVVIAAQAFSGFTGLEKIELPEGVTTFESQCFYGCTSLKAIVFPSTVASFESQALRNCASLESIKFQTLIPPTVQNSNVFQDVPTTCKIYVPQGSLAAYTSASNYPDPNTYQYIEY